MELTQNEMNEMLIKVRSENNNKEVSNIKINSRIYIYKLLHFN